MPDWSSLRNTGRSVAVWLAGFVLTGHVTHDMTYGDLKRISAPQLALRLGLMAFTLAVLYYFVANIPPGPALWVGWGLILGGGFGGLIVGSYLAITWYVDYSMAKQ